MGCACDSSDCNVGCFECDCQRDCKELFKNSPEELALCLGDCPLCSIVPDPPLISTLIDAGHSIPQIPDQFFFSLSLSGPCLAENDYADCVDDCHSDLDNASVECDVIKEACDGECISTCDDDEECIENCLAGSRTDLYDCYSEATSSAFGCEASCWSASSAGIKQCAGLTNGQTPCCQPAVDAETDTQTFAGCLEAADANYLNSMWSAIESYRAALRAAASSGASCMAACEDDVECIVDCAPPSWADWNLARSSVYIAEASAGATRAQARYACIRSELEKRSRCQARSLAELKRIDMLADADMWTVAASMHSCLSGCDETEFGDLTPPTCRGGCNFTAVSSWATKENERMHDRLDACMSFL